jgi:hypothetical protein
VKFLLLMVSFFCSVACADYIELTNGDKLMGQLIRIDGDHVIWKSENFGEQSVPKKKIRNLSRSSPVKINGNSLPCIIEGMEGEALVYYCGLRSQMNRVSLLSLKILTPYDDFIQGDYIHTGRLALSGTYARGNEVRDEWNLQAEASMRRGEWRHTLRSEYAEASWWHSEAQLKWNARYNLDWFFRERWFWYNNVTVGVEEQRGLDNYTSLSSGTGFQFWESHATALSMKAGLAYFDEQYTLPVVDENSFDPSDTFAAGHFATDFRYTLPWGVGFFHNNDFIQSVSDGSNWHLKSATGFNALLINKIYSEVKLDYSVDNDPQPGRQSRDRRMSVGVSYKW